MPESEEKNSPDSSPADQLQSFDAHSQQTISAGQVFLKATGLAVLFFLGLMLVTILVVGVFAYNRVNRFLSATDLTFNQARSMVETGLSSEPKHTNNISNFLILGVDTVPNKADVPPLTDTMLLLSINYQTGKINTVSLPRDLWSPEYQTKINSLYYYGTDRYPNNPEKFPVEVIESLTELEIHYPVVVSLESVAELVEIVEGVEITIPQSFTDPEFPRSDVDVTSTSDPDELYQTVTFTKGTETMTADRVLQYIRSRHAEGDVGTDLNRAARQQTVIAALVEKITQPEILLDPEKLAELYQWYQRHGLPYLDETEVIAIGAQLFEYRDQLQLQSHNLEIYPETETGSLYHPPTAETDNQWTYQVRDQEQLQLEIYDKLGI